MSRAASAPLMILLLTLSLGFSACGNSNNTTGPGSTVLAISGTTTVATVGQTSQLTATATPSGGPAQTVTNQTTWTSSNTSVATVNASGFVTAVSYGSTTITAAYQGATTQATFAVSIAGTWASPALDANQEQITWTLTQNGTSVTGAIGFLPGVPTGYAFSTQSVSGSLNGAAFTWTMTLIVSSDTARPDCVGQTTTINGTAQITSGTTMVLTLTGGTTPCDSKQPGTQLKDVGSSVTFTKQ